LQKAQPLPRGLGGVLQVETFLDAASQAGLQKAQPLPGGLGGVLQVETFLDAASQAGLQGAQPLPGGLGGVPPASFLLFYLFRRRRNK